jgi:hypothetical protein
MKDLLGMTGSDGFAHLSKHGRDETEAGTWEKLRWMLCGEKAGSWWSLRRRYGIIRSGRVQVVMIASLFQKIKEILAWDILQQEE